MNFIKKLSNLLIVLFLFANINLYSQNAILKGTVKNSLNNETLPFAGIKLEGTGITTQTDIDGNYELKNLKPGLYNIDVVLIGFETKKIFEVEVTNLKPTVLNISMDENVTKLKEAEIKGSVFIKKEESPISLRTIGSTEIARSPGGNRDISKVIQSLPGASQTVSFRNDIVIRGGSPNENRFYLDDVEVPYINHFSTQGASGGPVGMINVDFIKDVLFYSSAFPSNRNNSLSSIMDFKLKDGRSDRIGGKFTIGASDIGLMTEGPANKNSTFMVSVRRSYLQFLFDIIGLPFLPNYNDFQVKYKWKINKKDEITFIGLGAIDDFVLNTKLQNTGTDAQKYILGYLPVFTQWNYTNGLKYVHYKDKSFTTIVVSRNMFNNESKKYKNNDESKISNLILKYKSQEIENKFRIEQTGIYNGYKINFGLNYEYAKYSNSTYNLITLPLFVDTINFTSNLEFHKWGLFGQISKSYFNNRLGLSFGIRSDGNNYDRSMINSAQQLSPRFSLSYNITQQLTFNANAGVYYQLPPYTVLGYRNIKGELVNKSNKIRYIKAEHLVAGFEYITKTNLKVNIEGFYKTFKQYPFLVKDSISLANLGSDFGVIGNDEVKSTSEGRSYGLEVFIQQKLFMGFYGLITYTYVRSEFKDFAGTYKPSAWDNRNIINVVIGKSFKKNWEMGVKWRYASGSPYTPYNINVSMIKYNWDINQHGIPDYSSINSQRLNSFHQLDFRIDKKYYLKKFNFNFYFDIQNAYNFQTEQPPILDVKRDANGSPTTDPNNANKYSYNFIDNYTGTILPTIGVVIEF